jgi:hypothetical protein
MNKHGTIGTFILFIIVGVSPMYLIAFKIIPSLIIKFNFPLFCFSLVLFVWILFFFFAFISTLLSERHNNWLLKNGQKLKAKIVEVIENDLGDNEFDYYFICQSELQNKTKLQFKSKILKYNPTDYCNSFFNGEVDVYLNNSNTNDYFIDLRNY